MTDEFSFRQVEFLADQLWRPVRLGRLRYGPCVVYPRSMSEEQGSAFADGGERFGGSSRVTGTGSGDYAALMDSCRKFVAMKYRIDDFLDAMWRRFRDLEAVAFHGMDWLMALGQDPRLDDQSWLLSRCPEFSGLEPRAPSLRYALAPDLYAKAALPYFDGGSVRGEFELSDVDPSLVIGSSFDRRDGFSSDDEQNETLDRINERVGTNSPYGDCAYVSVGALPLYIAHEGKKRVRAFLEAGRNIHAWVGPGRLPEASALQLRQIEEPKSPYADKSPIYLIFDLSAGEYEVIPLPSITIPLLESYGVSWGPPKERGSWGGEFAWNIQELKRRALHSLVLSFCIP